MISGRRKWWLIGGGAALVCALIVALLPGEPEWEDDIDRSPRLVVFDVWVSSLGDDGVWSKPEMAIEGWALDKVWGYHGGRIFVRADPESTDTLNPLGPPPPEDRAMMESLFEMIAPTAMHQSGDMHAPLNVVQGVDGVLTAYFPSSRLEGLGGDDLFSSRHVDGAWSTPVNLGEPINTPEDEMDAVFTSDGRSFYFSSSRDSEHENLYVSRWSDDDGGWSAPELEPALNRPGADGFVWHLTADDATLFVGEAADLDEGMPGADVYGATTNIYVAERGADGRFGAPRSISDAINAAIYDDFLHLTPDGRQLFFVSSRGAEQREGSGEPQSAEGSGPL